MNEAAKTTANACRYCGSETRLHINGIPVCVACADLIEAGKKPPSRERPPNDSSEKCTG